MTTTCPKDEIFAALLDGALSQEEQDGLHRHLDGCPACAALVVELGHLQAPAQAEVWAERYLLEDVVGAGAMGVVHQAWDKVLERRVAIKRLHTPERLDWEDHQAARFLREARLLARVVHPHVLPIYDVGVWRGRPFMAMHLVEGGSLRQWLGQQARPWRQTLDLFFKAGAALEAAHQQGIVHRDIKPGNILVDGRRQVWVADFGLARALAMAQEEPAPQGQSPAAHPRLTQTGAVMGTPAYMAPEQHLGLEADARADQFSFAAALFEALYGELPFEGDTHARLAQEVCAGQLKPPPHAGVPRALYDALARALKPQAHERYPDMAALLEALRQAARPQPAAWMPPREARGRFLFLGRRRELEQLQALAVPGALVCVTGLGGVGKSTLARALVHSLEDRLQGVLRCSLHETAGVERLVLVMAQAMGLPLLQRDPAQQLGRALSSLEDVLCVIDGGEYLEQEAREVLERWRRGSAGVRFVITSRQPLGLAEEIRLPLEPWLPPGLAATPQELLAHPAVELFCALARIEPERLEPQELGEVAALVRALDGLPLALELAAARARVLSPAQMLQRLERRLDWLRDPRRADPRHSALRAVLEESWEALEPWARQALVQATVFQGPFTLEDAEAVLRPGEEDWLVLDAVDSLEAHQLLRTRRMHGRAWLEMLDSVRLFAAGRLEPQERQRSLERHARHMADVCDMELLRRAWSHEALPLLERLDLAREDLRQALRVSLEGQRPEWTAPLLLGLSEVWMLRGPFLQGAQLAQEALESSALSVEQSALLYESTARLWVYATDLDRGQVCLDRLRELLPRLGDQRPAVEARLLAFEGYRDMLHGRYQEAMERLEQAREVLEQVPRPPEELLSSVEGRMGQAWLRLGDKAQGRACLGRALEWARRCGDWRQEFVWLFYHGIADFLDGHLEEARAWFEQARALPLARRDLRLWAQLVEIAATVDKALGRWPQALEGFAEAIDLSGACGRVACVSVSNRAHLYQELGRYAEARRGYQEAHRQAMESGQRANANNSLMLLGTLERELGNLESAEGLLRQTLQVAREGSHTVQVLESLGELGLCQADRGELEAGIAELRRALAQAREIGDRRLEGKWCGELAALLHRAEGGVEEAEALFARSELLLGEMGHRSLWMRTLCLRGLARAQGGDAAGSRAVLRRAQPLAEVLHITGASWLGQALQRLRREALSAPAP